MSDRPLEPAADRLILERHLLRVRPGHGANCSSIGSVVDTLFATATVGAAVLAAVIAGLQAEPSEIIGSLVEEKEKNEPESPT